MYDRLYYTGFWLWFVIIFSITANCRWYTGLQQVFHTFSWLVDSHLASFPAIPSCYYSLNFSPIHSWKSDQCFPNNITCLHSLTIPLQSPLLYFCVDWRDSRPLPLFFIWDELRPPHSQDLSQSLVLKCLWHPIPLLIHFPVLRSI